MGRLSRRPPTGALLSHPVERGVPRVIAVRALQDVDPTNSYRPAVVLLPPVQLRLVHHVRQAKDAQETKTVAPGTAGVRDLPGVQGWGSWMACGIESKHTGCLRRGSWVCGTQSKHTGFGMSVAAVPFLERQRYGRPRASCRYPRLLAYDFVPSFFALRCVLLVCMCVGCALVRVCACACLCLRGVRVCVCAVFACLIILSGPAS